MAPHTDIASLFPSPLPAMAPVHTAIRRAAEDRQEAAVQCARAAYVAATGPAEEQYTAASVGPHIAFHAAHSALTAEWEAGMAAIRATYRDALAMARTHGGGDTADRLYDEALTVYRAEESRLNAAYQDASAVLDAAYRAVLADIQAAFDAATLDATTRYNAAIRAADDQYTADMEQARADMRHDGYLRGRGCSLAFRRMAATGRTWRLMYSPDMVLDAPLPYRVGFFALTPSGGRSGYPATLRPPAIDRWLNGPPAAPRSYPLPPCPPAAPLPPAVRQVAMLDVAAAIALVAVWAPFLLAMLAR